MNIIPDRGSNRVALVPTAIASLALAIVAAHAAFAEPMALRQHSGMGHGGNGHGGRSQPQTHDLEFVGYLEQAVDLLREQMLEVPHCRTYFEHLGVDLADWLAPNEPPYVVTRRLTALPWRSTSPICGGAQGRPPFEFLFVDKDCFRGRDVCELASLLLHEMGHLARRDTRDNEPPKFFIVCRLSACVDPARFE